MKNIAKAIEALINEKLNDYYGYNNCSMVENVVALGSYNLYSCIWGKTYITKADLEIIEEVTGDATVQVESAKGATCFEQEPLSWQLLITFEFDDELFDVPY